MNTPVASLPALLPCPFCGAEDVALWHANNQWRAGCAACGASPGPDRNNRTKDAAIAAWNRRALTPDVASLPAKWRAKSSEIAKPYGFVTEHALGKAQALDACADELEAALAKPEQPGSSVQGALEYLRPHLEAGTFAAPDWAIDLASILTGGKRLTTPPPAPAAEQGESIARRIDRVVFDPMRVADKTHKERQPEARGVEGMVLAEVERATAKFPTWPTDPLHAVAVLGEEFGELTKAVLQSVYEPHKNPPGAVRTEALQTAAMALRFLASVDRYEGARCPQHKQGEQ